MTNDNERLNQEELVAEHRLWKTNPAAFSIRFQPRAAGGNHCSVQYVPPYVLLGFKLSY